VFHNEFRWDYVDIQFTCESGAEINMLAMPSISVKRGDLNSTDKQNSLFGVSRQQVHFKISSARA
jgi:hypothetical protein